MYHRVMRWVKHPHAPYYLMGLSFTEASFFPIPPDVMLAPMALSKPDKALWYALLTTISSTLGGLFGYILGMFFFILIQPLIVKFGYFPAYEHVQIWFQDWGFWALIVAGFTPIPYKLFTIAAGAMHMAVLPFILAAFIGRGGRFFLVAALMRFGGAKMEAALSRYVDIIGWAVLGLVGAAIILVMSGCNCVNDVMCDMMTGNEANIVDGTAQPLVNTPDYTVSKGDTLYSVAFAADKDFRLIVAINHLKKPYKLHAGQKLKLEVSDKVKLPDPDLVEKDQIELQEPVFYAKKKTTVKTKVYLPLPRKNINKIAQHEKNTKVSKKSADNKVYRVAVKKHKPKISEGKSKVGPKSVLHWLWPSQGKVIQTFSLERTGNKGLDIAGKYGSPVRATAPGVVVYSGSGLRGYGNLIIIKHNAKYLSAYAYNKELLVKEGAQVKSGQLIAKMGRTDSGQVKLHFEIRRVGKPVDPKRYLS